MEKLVISVNLLVSKIIATTLPLPRVWICFRREEKKGSHHPERNRSGDGKPLISGVSQPFSALMC